MKYLVAWTVRGSLDVEAKSKDDAADSAFYKFIAAHELAWLDALNDGEITVDFVEEAPC